MMQQNLYAVPDILNVRTLTIRYEITYYFLSTFWGLRLTFSGHGIP